MSFFLDYTNQVCYNHVMSNFSKSPHRHSFQKENYLKRQADDGKTPENNEEVKAMREYFDDIITKAQEKEAEESWRENNMEADLRSCDWILAKTRASRSYAQNLYAAMCNNDFQKNEFMPLLAGKTWSCSWRYAGGIIADMRQEGDYIDWYCSGIRNTADLDDEQYSSLSKEEQEEYLITKRYVGECYVTDEIRADLKQLGWIVLEESPKE